MLITLMVLLLLNRAAQSQECFSFSFSCCPASEGAGRTQEAGRGQNQDN